MTEERQKAICAIYVWCRRMDGLVDDPNAVYMSSAILDRWEDRLHDIFNGQPYDMLDAALTDIVSKFPLDIKISRARFYFNRAEEGVSQLQKASRWPVWSSLILYRKILDAIEDNDYDNLTKRACVGCAKKFLTLPLTYTRSLSNPKMKLGPSLTRPI
ncbi:Phytoene synthase, chloroplastic [Glycine soja]|nr:Phytoene synthase, chloroplastic [Glycine soja]